MALSCWAGEGKMLASHPIPAVWAGISMKSSHALPTHLWRPHSSARHEPPSTRRRMARWARHCSCPPPWVVRGWWQRCWAEAAGLSGALIARTSARSQSTSSTSRCAVQTTWRMRSWCQSSEPSPSPRCTKRAGPSQLGPQTPVAAPSTGCPLCSDSPFYFPAENHPC